MFSERTNNRYLKWLRLSPCFICGNKSVVHHIRGTATIPGAFAGGTGLKPYDVMSVPLCHVHHEEIHKGQEEFEKKHNIDIKKILISCLAQYITQKEL